MKDKYTLEDVPMMLNSISWQLKRIADALESKDQAPDIKSKIQTQTKIRALLDKLDADKN